MLTVRAIRGIALAGLCCSVMLACASGGGAARVTETYVVLAQDTLYSIAWRHDLDYRDLARWNNIGADYRLRVGQVLTLGPGRAASASQPTAPRAVPTKPAAAELPLPRIAKAPLDPTALHVRWVWPTDPTSAPRPVPGGGILLLGRLGQDIRAASAGRVVYTGNGLRGYGNLVIIKHGDTLLSSYAHNQEVLVHEGQELSVGQLIAHMGMGPHQVSALYFEIRVNGKPIDPAPYLPAVR